MCVEDCKEKKIKNYVQTKYTLRIYTHKIEPLVIHINSVKLCIFDWMNECFLMDKRNKQKKTLSFFSSCF